MNILRAVDTDPRGLVEMTNDEYHQARGVSKSHLDEVAKSPLHYWHRYLDPEREPTKQTESLLLGSAVHCAVLEPDLFNSTFLIMPGFSLRSPKGRAARDEWLEEEAKGAQVLTQAQRDLALGAAAAVRGHPVVGPLLTRGKAEQAVFAMDPNTGALIKCKLDHWDPEGGYILDLKTADDVSPGDFARSVATHRYHVQQPWYQDVLTCAFGEAPPYWVFAAVEPKPPYPVAIYYLSPEDVDLGRRLARRDLGRLMHAFDTGVFEGYPTVPQPLALPGWYRSIAERELS